MRKRQSVKYVKWSELMEQAKQRLLTAGHESNRPTEKDQQREGNAFAEDGSGWCDYYALAGFFFVPAK